MKKGARMIVIFVAIILITIMGVTIGGRTRVTAPEDMIGRIIIPIQKLFLKGGKITENALHSVFAFKSIAKENKLLKSEIEKLNQKLIQVSLDRNELNELRNLADALNYVNSHTEYSYVAASVSGKNTGNWFNIFTIDVGKNKGVIKDSIVINGEGLIGKVFEVGETWAKVITIIDNKSSVSFEVLRDSQYIGIVRGSIKGELTGYLIDPQAEVLVGDKLITSGLSIYPKGILIGQIKEVIKKENELLKKITVEPVVNFKKIDKVLVMTPRE